MTGEEPGSAGTQAPWLALRPSGDEESEAIPSRTSVRKFRPGGMSQLA